MKEISIASPSLGRDEQERVRRLMAAGELADGSEVRRFEEAFAEYCGTRHGVATANGTAALHTALHAIGVGSGDGVVTTPFTFIATANAIRFAGGTPVFADVDPVTLNLDPDSVEAVLRDRGDEVAAILPVHLYGLPVDMDRFSALAREYDVAIVEDAAQAHGARYDDRPVGSFGDVAAFSFYPTKNMTTAEGGMVVTDRDDVAERAARFVNHGRTGPNRHGSLGHNFRMTSLAATIGRTQLERLPSFVQRRRTNAARLSAGLADAAGIDLPIDPPDRRHAYNQFTVRVPDRAGLRSHLTERSIETAVYYPTPVHEQPAYADVPATFPAAERAAAEVLSIPVHPGLSADDVDTVVGGIRGYARGG